MLITLIRRGFKQKLSLTKKQESLDRKEKVQDDKI